jgi:hypothetical protein
MGGAPGGGPPPPPPGGTGPAMAPGPQMGAAGQGLSQVKTALEMLQKALPGLPMGDPVHTAVLKAVSDLTKHVAAGADDQSDKIQQLVQAARGAQTNPQGAALAQMFPGGGGGGSPAPPPPGM